MRRAWLAVLAPDPALTVSQWADRHRVLSSRSATEAGP
jgi:phage terminase large subunit GpA-like protein